RHAAVWGLTRPIDYLIEAGVSVDTVISQRSGLVRNALCVAASRGHEHIVRHLVSRGAKMTINHIGEDSPMHVAVRKKNVNMVRLLVKLGMCPDIYREGMTALVYAVEKGQP